MMPKVHSRFLFLRQLQQDVVVTLFFQLLLWMLILVVPTWKSVGQSALSATLSVLVVMVLRKVLVLLVGKRNKKLVVLEMLLLGGAFGLIFQHSDFATLWHILLMVFFLVASLMGLFLFRFSGFFMAASCAIAGGLLF